jgi:AcrR family transcriptional regulator
MQQGRHPSLEEIASEALVSRATAYRYFPQVETLLLEAALDVAVPDASTVLRDAPQDAVSRVERIDTALHEMMLANEPQLRMMLKHSMERRISGDTDAALPARQNRRTPLIEAALEPVRKQFRPADLEMLTRALALIVGTEAMIVFKDVLQVDDATARKVKRWAIRALVESAIRTARVASAKSARANARKLR